MYLIGELKVSRLLYAMSVHGPRGVRPHHFPL